MLKIIEPKETYEDEQEEDSKVKSVLLIFVCFSIKTRPAHKSQPRSYFLSICLIDDGEFFLE